MQRTIQTLLVAGLSLGLSQAAAAQTTAASESILNRPWGDRVFGGINFGVQAASSDLNEATTFVVYDEQGTLVTNSSFGSDGLFDFSIGARAWRNLGIAIGYHSVSTTGDGTVDGSVPHPLVFDRPRTFSVPVDGLDRDEHAWHLMFGWMLPVNEKLDVFVYGGPSFFRLHQEVIAGVSVAEQGPPYTTVVVQPSIETRKKSATGFNIGADATYFLLDKDKYRLGVGGFFRYTGASADIRVSSTESSTDLGGPQFGFGLRVRY